ncbi:MAG: class I SAM-dependent methyltransferase [Chloroflexi bacterium]|nr:class I SAM-dependent methyltransferase [Chloroflexota bacterium]
MTETDRELLRATFDEDAALYDRARPSYPEQLFDDLVQLAGLQPGASLLEIGCGTGQATLPLARRGFRIVCVELGDNLAAVARQNLAPFPDVEVVTGPLELWDPARAAFDLVYAAASWHWIDPNVRYRKAADLLNRGASLAIISGGHAFPKDADPFFFEIQEVYRALGMEPGGEVWPPPLPEDVPDMRDEMEASGLFGDVQVRRYVWELKYTADEYIALLNTFSGHIALDPEKREFLYRNVRERIDARADPRVRRHWLAILNLARKIRVE